MDQRDLPQLLADASRDVKSLIEQLQALQVRCMGLETQMRITQHDLIAAETELNEMRKVRANENR